MLKDIQEKIKTIPSHIWILFIIILVGIFLRTYQFHNWLNFDGDQVRDAVLVDNVTSNGASWPQIGPTMRKSNILPDGALFHLGPIYYYFQIISAKIFGTTPEAMAYPDLFFSVLAIPLFYFFFKRYFEINLALTITGIYAFSFFSIQYSRFAWNPNLIPFFTLLLLIALHEFLIKNINVQWRWVILLGIAFGVGIQLHAILILLFSTIVFFVFLFSIWQNKKIWYKWLVVFLIAVILNGGQIINDQKNNFSNAKIFLNFPATNGDNDIKHFLKNFEEGIGCNLEANTYMLLSSSGTHSSSSGSDSCSYLYTNLLHKDKFVKTLNDLNFWLIIFPGILFSILGYGLLIYFFCKEKNLAKRYFLGLVGFYMLISFFVMLPALRSGFREFRYFIQDFFTPFLLFGFLMVFFKQKYQKFFFIFFVFLIIFVAIVNLISIQAMTNKYAKKMGNGRNTIILGEIELIVDYLKMKNRDTIYLSGSTGYLSNFSEQLAYLSKRQNFNIIIAENKIPYGEPLFRLIDITDTKNSESKIDENQIVDMKNFGTVEILELKN